MPVLFDLDGTLLDTVPDLCSAMNTLLKEYSLPEISVEQIRPLVSYGVKAFIKEFFINNKTEIDSQKLQNRFLDIYNNNIYKETRAFAGIEELLLNIEKNNIKWGIVTNKPAFLTKILTKIMGYDSRAAIIVSGDTTKHSKPHPLPLQFACQRIICSPKNCIYIGDAKSDMIAGKRAGMRTILANYGYISEDISNWPYDAIVENVASIWKIITKWRM